MKNPTKYHSERGFTLIEAVVYLGLFGILMGGAVVSAFNLVEATGREQTHLMLQQEGNFLLGKITWAVSGAQSINTPGGAQFGSQLSVNKIIGLDINGLPIVSSVIISLPTAPGNAEIQDAILGTWPLNNTNTQVERLGFFHALASGNGIDPESIVASTTLSARTGTGALISEDFSTTIYIRR